MIVLCFMMATSGGKVFFIEIKLCNILLETLIGFHYRACLDTTETGDLDKAALIGEYSVTHEYATLTKEDQLNYSINVHNDGNILEIVSMCCKYFILKTW